jgi:hypothetical protein
MLSTTDRNGRNEKSARCDEMGKQPKSSKMELGIKSDGRR